MQKAAKTDTCKEKFAKITIKRVAFARLKIRFLSKDLILPAFKVKNRAFERKEQDIGGKGFVSIQFKFVYVR